MVSAPRQRALLNLLKTKISLKESYILERFSRSIILKLEERGFAQLHLKENKKVIDNDVLVGIAKEPNLEQQTILCGICGHVTLWPRHLSTFMPS